MNKISTDTYRDGGTVSVSEDDKERYYINRMRSSVDVGAVFPCYPADGDPLSTKDELKTAEEMLMVAGERVRAPNELIMIGKAIEWIYEQYDKINRLEALSIAEPIILKPCGHCGGEVDWMTTAPPTIRCSKCSMEFRVGVSSTVHATADVWNERTGE